MWKFGAGAVIAELGTRKLEEQHWAQMRCGSWVCLGFGEVVLWNEREVEDLEVVVVAMSPARV